MVTVIDVEGIGGFEKLDSIIQRTQKTILLVDALHAEYENQLLKPVGFSKLIKAIENEYHGNPEKDKKETAKKLGNKYEAIVRPCLTEFLIGEIYNKKKSYIAGQANSTCKINLPQSKWIIIDFQKNAVYTNFSKKRSTLVYYLCFTKITNNKLGEITLNEAPEGYLVSVSLDWLLWEVVHRGFSSTLMREIDTGIPLRLSEWPNVPKLRIADELLPLISSWFTAEQVVDKVFQNTTIIEEKLVAFINGCHVLGILVEAPKNNNLQIFRNTGHTSPLKSVFKMILNKVNRKAA